MATNTSIQVGASTILLMMASLSVVAFVPTDVSSYTPIGTIMIFGNDQFTPANGVVSGSGTMYDPYVIEGWELNVPVDGIFISSTDAWFVISDCYVHGEYPAIYGPGISFGEVANGRIESCVLSNITTSIAISGCTNIAISDCHISNGSMAGIEIYDCSDVRISGCSLKNCGWGVEASFCEDVSVSNNDLENCSLHSIFSIACPGIDILSNNFTDAFIGVELMVSEDFDLSQNIFLDCGMSTNVIGGLGGRVSDNVFENSSMLGLTLIESPGCNIAGNEFSHSGVAIFGEALDDFNSHVISSNNTVNGLPVLYYKDGTSLALDGVPAGQVIVVNYEDVALRNLVLENSSIGIELAFVEFGVVEDSFLARNSYAGCYASLSNNLIFDRNEVINNTAYGIVTSESSDIRFRDNLFNNTGPAFGLAAISCSELNLSSNEFVEDGLSISGMNADHFTTHSISLDNLVNGKPLVYLKNETGLVLDGIPVGQLIVTNCSDIRVNNLEIGRTDIGVMVWDSTSVWIESCNMSENSLGLVCMGAGPIILNMSEFSGNIVAAYFIYCSMFLSGSGGGLVFRNNFTDNLLGLHLSSSDGFTIYRNNFIGNAIQAIESGTPWLYSNRWHSGTYPMGGNYWSDYSGEDLNSGPSQDIPGSDGFGDTPHEYMGIYDLYPLMEHYTGNLPPVALFSVSPSAARPGATIYVSPTYWLDPEDLPDEVEVRWDWEDDGIWDTDWSTDKNVQISYDDPGVYVIRLEARDTGGLTDQMTGTVTIDGQAPTTVATISGTMGEEGWYATSVSVALNATDDLSGIVRTDYQIDGGGWYTYTGPFSVGNGVHVVDYRSCDVAGNFETASSMTLQVDTSAPVTEFSVSGTLGANGWFTSDVTVALDALDANSGINSTNYRLADEDWQVYALPFILSQDGIHVVQFYSSDIAGHDEASQESTIRIDKSAPVSSASLIGTEGDASWYTSPQVEVEITASDSGSGVNETMYRLDDGDWQEYDDVIVIPDEGIHSLEYYTRDLAGNVEESVLTEVKIDISAPQHVLNVSSTVTAIGADAGWSVSPVDVEVDAWDNLSGVALTYYRIDGGDWQEYETVLEFAQEGEHLLECYSVDVAGNQQEIETTTLKIDRTPPIIEAEPSEDGVVFTSNSPTVEVFAEDSVSGIFRVEVSIDGGPFEEHALQGDLELTGISDGTHTLEVRAIDNAGNVATKLIEFKVSTSIFSLDGPAGPWAIVGIVIAACVAALLLVSWLVILRRKAPPEQPLT